MFYSQFILAKKGPLGTIWIAAHLERKLRKNQVADTDIGISVDSILFPDVPIALRLSSHLLLGVVRIYSRKVNYLFDDCSEALLKIKQAFRSTAVDLPPEESTAPYHSITLPETFDLDDFELPDSDIFQGNYVDHHVSTREQITLQDNMEGVVYSTSQFGLDERFGDGDASGLDLEEELLLDKVAASGNAGVVMDLDNDPQGSGKPTTPLNHEGNHEDIAQNSAMVAPDQIGSPYDADFVEYAHAPCTPGLMEEPNLSNVKEASAFDDHLEVEDHTLTESTTIENNCNKLDLNNGDNNVEGWSLLNDMVDPETVLHMAGEENGHISGSKEIEQLKPQGDSTSAAATMEHESSDAAVSVKDISLVSEFPDRIDTTSDVAITGEDMQNGVIGNNKTGIHSTDAVLDGLPRGVRLDEAETSPSLREPCVSGNVERPYPLCDAAALNTESPGKPECETPETETCLVPKDSAECTSMHILQRCNSRVDEPNLLNIGGDSLLDPELSTKELEMCASEASRRDEPPYASTEVQVEEGHASDVTKPVLEENRVLQPDSNDKQVDFAQVDDQAGNFISRESRSENFDSSELPAPEKLLSVPETVAELPNDNILVESTPDNALSVGGDISGDVVTTISGKKRSFTESTLTMQSLNSVESFGVTGSKTAGEIPDDDDLLSSILVGRRSSVLKLKPTPLPRPQITSMKRPRSVARSTASKRKVLMDDTMVLHGDTIRQQLTSTEDIRRVRKKAPCTRTEVWTIQKQFLEEEIFIEALFTGSSKELLSLHSQMYDLSEIRVCQDEKATSSEAASTLEFSIAPNVTEEIGREASAEDMLLGKDAEEIPVQTDNQQVGEHLVSSETCDIQVPMKANSDLPEPMALQPEHFEESAEIDGRGVAVADAICLPDVIGVDPSTSSDFILGNTVNSSVSSEVLPSNDSGVLPDQKTTDAELIDIGASTVDVQGGNEIETTGVLEKADDELHVVVAESNADDKFLLEETEGAASIDCSAVSNHVALTFDHAVEETGKNDLGVVIGDEVLAAHFDAANDKEPTSTRIFYGEFNVDSSYPMEINVDSENAVLNNVEYQEFDPQGIVDAEIAAGDHAATEDRVGFESFNYAVDGHDTGFLNVDDDEVDDEDNDYMPSTEETRFLENSGWSSRTRAVAKYLQTLFDKEAESGKKVLPMDNLLAGKSRKEASRMFFEALVLKTRDYIQVEQGTPFDNINIKPRIKLVKLDF